MTRTIQDYAAELAAQFETRTRDNGDRFVCIKDGAPDDELLTDIIYEAHDGMLPDDFLYQFVSESLDLLAESEDWDDIDPEPSVYTMDLLRWLESSLGRIERVDDALREGADGLCNALMWAQANERREVLDVVRARLEAAFDDDSEE